MSDDLSQEHAAYRELADSVKDVDPSLPNFPGNDTSYPEYGGGRPEPEPREQRQPEQPRPQDYARDQQAPQEQRQQPQQHQGYRELPPQDDDPIGHFDARQANLEAWAQQAHANQQHKDFWRGIEASENHYRQELSEGEYDQAIDALKAHRMQELYQQFPDTHENAVLAYRHGFQSPAHMRMAQLQKDAMDVAAHAMRNGIPPAAAYYQAALTRGVHKPQTVMMKSFSRNVLKNIDKASDKEFDQFWRAYEIASKQVEGK